MTDLLGKVWCGDALGWLAQLPTGVIVITDPPYPSREDMGGAPGKLTIWLKGIRAAARFALVKWTSAGIQEAASSVPSGWELRHTLVWHKPMTHGRQWKTGLHAHWEPILVYGDGMCKAIHKDATDHFSCSPCLRGSREDVGHPAQMPERVASWLLRDWTSEGDIVADPFCGSGTVGVVAERMGRMFAGCDVSQTYVDMAERRIARERDRMRLPLEASL